MEGWIMPDIRTSALGGVPFGTSSDRPTSPSIGQTFYNGTLGVQEIYTASGWLPATGANDFNVTLNGTITTATFTKEYFAGAYTIASALLDSTYDIYVYDTQGNNVGYTKSPSLNATGNFNKIVVVGGTQGDLLSFSYKTTFTATNTTSEVTAGPFLTSVTPTSLMSQNNSAVVTGGNFALNVDLKIVDSQGNEVSPKSFTRSSNTAISFVRPDTFAPGTYSLKVTNPAVTSPTGSNLYILTNSITAGTAPIWQTLAGNLPTTSQGISYSTTLSASDTENSIVTYSVVSGSLQSGLSLNSSTGVISGTPSSSVASTFTVRATDAGGNFVDRVFILGPAMEGGTITTFGSYRIHAFTSTGANTLKINKAISADYMLVAGGGAGGAAGGGAGGLVFAQNITASTGTYTFTVGAPGAGQAPRTGGADESIAKDGLPTYVTPSISGIVQANGGQGAWGWDFQPTTTNGIWGSGAGGPQSSSGPYNGGGFTSGQGNAGGGDPSSSAAPYPGGGGGGAGAAGQATSGNTTSGSGGVGRDMSSYYGTSYGVAGWFAGGGGGATHTSPISAGSGGQGGGGAGATAIPGNGVSGTINTGGGGGGYINTANTLSGSGGSGIVLVRYLINA
jgi:hypothetical protein